MRKEIAEAKFINDDVEDYISAVTTIELICGKWKALILWQICCGHVRFNELRRLIPKASQKMLSQQLHELESDGLINRHVYPENPPRVEYSLTELGRTLGPVFEMLSDWGSLYRQQMEGAIKASPENEDLT